MGTLLDRSRGFHLFDGLLDPAQQLGIPDGGQIRVERFAEGCVHEARAKRWKVFFRMTGEDFSSS